MMSDTLSAWLYWAKLNPIDEDQAALVTDIEQLQAKLTAAGESIAGLNRSNTKLIYQRNAIMDKNTRLREALEFYASESIYSSVSAWNEDATVLAVTSAAQQDCGERARAALEKK